MNNTQKALALAAVVLVALVGYKVAMRPEASIEATPKQADTTTEAPVAATPAAVVKQLTTQTTYKEPAGESSVGFTLSVGTDGVITDATVEVLATHDVSKARQAAFAA